MSEDTNYVRIAKAIAYINQNFQKQPSLAEIADHIHLSPAHLQRIFTEWAGISPKKFLQYISLQHAKWILKNPQENSILDATHKTGLSSTSRLHDLFIQIEGMTPAEYKNAGASLHIHYSFLETLFGPSLLASTGKGICYLAFTENDKDPLFALQALYPNATYSQQIDTIQEHARRILQRDDRHLSKLKLHLKGTPFQLKVWESLLKIPMGQLTSYAALAQAIGNNNAARAVGTAIARNPVALLIPCHRVIQSSGNFGEYMWGTTRKTAIIGWEAANTHAQQ